MYNKTKTVGFSFSAGQKKICVDRPPSRCIYKMECPAARDEFSYRYTNEPRQHLGDEDHLTHLAVDACARHLHSSPRFSVEREKKGNIRTISLSWRVEIACNRCDFFSFVAVSSRQRKLLYVSALRFKSLLLRIRSRHKTPGAVRQQQPQRVHSN